MRPELNEIIELLKNGTDKKRITDILSCLSAEDAKVIRRELERDLIDISDLEECKRNFKTMRNRLRDIEEQALAKLKGNGPDNDGPGVA